MKKGKLLAIFILLIVFGCQNNDNFSAEPKADLPEIQLASFSFLKSHNPELLSDVAATITGPNIKMQLPNGVSIDKLVATFATRTKQSKVYIETTEQESNVSVNTFEAPVDYKIKVLDGPEFTYNVEVNSQFPELDMALNSFMLRYNIPGISIAIVKNEKLVLAKSYGYADREANKLVRNDSQFRIASISKPITATAILKLIQDGKLSFDSKAFGKGGVLGYDYGTPPMGSDIEKITVKHLLDHKSGWMNESGDPMFLNMSYTHRDIIADAVSNRPLRYKPGTTYNYSNLGYCVLGRIIEKVSGRNYADYIQSELLQPAGITDMRIAGNSTNENLPNEVKYYQNEWSPYYYNINRMDANGGWVATATDLMRFMVSIDRNLNKPDLVDSNLLSSIYLGDYNWSHSGSLPGTSSMLTRLNDEFSFVVLANTRVDNAPLLIAEEINNILKQKILTKISWPEVDLFESPINLIQYAQQEQ